MITNYMQLLNKRYGDKLDDNAKDYMFYAVDGASRLKQMMDGLLTYSRIGRQNFNVSDVRLGDIIEKTRKHLGSKYPAESYRFDSLADESRQIKADPDLLLKLLYNLIDNALKFNHNKLPEIKISLLEEDDRWILSVQDNGIGIDKEYHGKVFGIFQKLHNNTEYPGLGLGLAICEKIARKHNGEIWIDSEIDNGATFHISIEK